MTIILDSLTITISRLLTLSTTLSLHHCSIAHYLNNWLLLLIWRTAFWWGLLRWIVFAICDCIQMTLLKYGISYTVELRFTILRTITDIFMCTICKLIYAVNDNGTRKKATDFQSIKLVGGINTFLRTYWWNNVNTKIHFLWYYNNETV